MTLFIALMAISNMLGGRWENIWPASPINGRLLWRCIAPGLFAGLYALQSHDVITSLFVWIAVTAGSALWFPWGWSFEEIHGERDLTKYPAWVRWIGYQIMPYNEANIKRDKLRGALIKGIRGSFDILTFALLSAINPEFMGVFFHNL